MSADIDHAQVGSLLSEKETLLRHFFSVLFVFAIVELEFRRALFNPSSVQQWRKIRRERYVAARGKTTGRFARWMLRVLINLKLQRLVISSRFCDYRL